MSNDVLITPASRKIEFKDSGGTVDAKIETDSSGNLTITNPGGDISIGDTTADVFIGDGVNSVDLVFEQNGEIRGTSGVTLTLGDSNTTLRTGTDLSLNSNDITNVATVTATGNITTTQTIQGDTIRLTNDASDTSRHRISVYDGGTTSYGMMLWNTNGTSGDWGTMIYGPNQSNRRISFGKITDTSFTNHADVTEAMFLDLDDNYLHIKDRLVHYGDSDTYIDFTTNRVKIVAAGVTKFDTSSPPVSPNTSFSSGKITISDAAVPLIFEQSDQSNGFIGKWWRMPVDGFGLRFDVSLTGDSLFSTYRDVLTLETSGNVAVKEKLTVGENIRLSGSSGAHGSIVTEGQHSSYGNIRIVNPGGAEMYSRSSTETGAIKITLPVSWTSTMLRMTIQIYEYALDRSFTVYCGGYNYSTSSAWVNTFAQIISSTDIRRNFNVRFAHDGTKCTILIGELTSTWSYPQVAVTDFQAGFSNASVANWEDGWDVSIEASSLGTVSSTESNVDITEFLKDGTQADPALRFKSDTNLGVYRDTTDRIGFAMGGTTKLTMGTKSGYTESVYGPVIDTNSDSLVLPTTAYFNNSNVYLQKTGSSARLHGDGGVRFSYYNGSSTTIGMTVTGGSGGGRVKIGNSTSATYGLEVSNASTSQSATGTMYVNAKLNSSGKGLVIDSNTRTTNDNAVAALETITRANTTGLKVQVDGNVGIGTNSPAARLDLGSFAVNTQGAILARQSGGDNNFKLITGTEAGTGTNADFFKIGLAYQSTDNAMVRFYRGGGGTDGYLAFTTSDTERMIISKSGDVGIGLAANATPADKVEIRDNHSQLRLTDSDDNKFVQFSYSGGFLAVRNNNSTTSVNLFSLHEDGDFGIGTLAPSAKLDVRGDLLIVSADSEQTNSADSTTVPDATGATSIKIQSSSYTDGRYTTRIAKIDRSGGLPVYFQESLGTANSYTNRMRIGTHSRTNGSYVVETFGPTMIGGRIGIQAGEYIRKHTSAWTNAPEHTVLHNSYKTNLGDYVSLKAAGNGTSGHGIITVADNGIYFGKSSAETGELVANNDATAPLDTNYGHIDATGIRMYGTVHDFLSNQSDVTFNVGRNGSEKIQLYVADGDCTITADQDSDDNATHNFILDRTFDGTGANNFSIRKSGGEQFKLDTNANATFYGNLYIPNVIYHSGDTDTYINFGTDTFFTSTGGDVRTAVSNQAFQIEGGAGLRLLAGGRSDSPEGTYYNWFQTGAGTDTTTWWKICDVDIGTGLYKALALHIRLKSQFGNFGSTEQTHFSEYTAFFPRSGGVQDDSGTPRLSGYDTDNHELRIYKTGTGAYELQSRMKVTYRDLIAEIQVLSTNGGTVTMNQSLSAGTTSGGTAYTASQSHSSRATHMFQIGKFTDLLVGSNATNLDSTGRVQAGSAGTILKPSFSTVGDVDTGMYFPAAGEIGFTNNNSESVRITSAGNVGIGEDDTGSINDARLVVRDGDYSGNQDGGIIIQVGDATSNHWRAGFKIKSTSGGTPRTVIDTVNGNTGGFTEALSFASATGAATFGSSVTLPLASPLYFGGGAHTYIQEDIDDRLRFFTGGAEFMRFTEDANDANDKISFYKKAHFTFTDNVANENFDGLFIDHNISGSQSTAGNDYTHRSLLVDTDSSATGGDTIDEHRIRGIESNVRVTGDSDSVFGIYGSAEGQHSAGTVSEVVGVYGVGIADELTTGRNTTVYGMRAIAYGYGAGTGGSTTFYGIYPKVHLTTEQDKNTGSVYGVRSEIETDDPGQAQTTSTIFGVRSTWNDDSNGNVSAANSYLFYGNYDGTCTVTGSKYGVYINSDVVNRFVGPVRSDDQFQISGSTVIDVNRTFRGAGIKHDNTGDTVIDLDNNTYTSINDPDGTTRIKIGGNANNTGGDLQTTYTNNLHRFYLADGTTTLAFFYTGVADFQSNTIYGGSIDVSGNSDANSFRINGTAIVNSSQQLINLTFNGGNTGVRFERDADLQDTAGVKRLRFNSSGSSVYNSTNGHVFQHAGVNKADIQTDGDAIFAGNVTAYGSPSDINLKENIETIPNAVEKVQKLDGITFNYKKDGGRSTGLIAQQLQEVLPEVVYTAKDLEGEEHLAVRYGNVVGLLVEALKEQQTQIDNLTALVNELKEK